MGKRIVSQRHKPSFNSYLRHNIKTTFAMAERAELMVSLSSIIATALLAAGTGYYASKISIVLESWYAMVAIALLVFFVVLFCIITPFRMWRKASWVANIERVLEGIVGCYEEGGTLLQAHHSAIRSNPNMKNEPQAIDKWFIIWHQNYLQWINTTSAKIDGLYPVEARLFKSLATYTKQLEGGLSSEHNIALNQLSKRLEMIDAIIKRHQPSLLPE